MPKIMQNLVILMEPSDDARSIQINGGNMYLNRFCIDEDSAFELSGVHYLKETSRAIVFGGLEYFFTRNSKGKGYS